MGREDRSMSAESCIVCGQRSEVRCENCGGRVCWLDCYITADDYDLCPMCHDELQVSGERPKMSGGPTIINLEDAMKKSLAKTRGDRIASIEEMERASTDEFVQLPGRDVAAIVRALRAALATEPWRVVDVFKVGMKNADAIKPTSDLAAALEPWRTV